MYTHLWRSEEGVESHGARDRQVKLSDMVLGRELESFGRTASALNQGTTSSVSHHLMF